jgi:hypothetical protein
MRTPLTALFVILPLLPWSGPAGDPAQDGDPAPVNWRTSPELTREHYQKELRGAWQLTRAQRGGEVFSGGNAAGYAIFSEGYMALELHLFSEDHLPDTDGTFFQTGVHRWQINAATELETHGLIGTTSFTEDEQVTFEPPGQRRAFRVAMEGKNLVLRHTDNWGELRFRRLGDLPFPGSRGPDTDFYGRKLPPDGK